MDKDEMDPGPALVSMSEFVRLLKKAPEDEWSILVDADDGLLLFVSGKDYRTPSWAHTAPTKWTMFIYTVCRIMEEKGKPWIKVDLCKT